MQDTHNTANMSLGYSDVEEAPETTLPEPVKVEQLPGYNSKQLQNVTGMSSHFSDLEVAPEIPLPEPVKAEELSGESTSEVVSGISNRTPQRNICGLSQTKFWLLLCGTILLLVGGVVGGAVGGTQAAKHKDTSIDQSDVPPRWRNLGELYYGIPAVVSSGRGRTDVFIRGTNTAVWHKWQDNSGPFWKPSDSGYEDLGGQILGNVTAVSWGLNQIDVFALGTDKACWHMSWNGTAWQAWESLGGRIIGDISAVSWGTNRLDLFVRGTDDGVWTKSWNGSAWSPNKTEWTTLGGTTVSEPKAVCWGANRIDVFVRSTNNGIYQKTWNGSNWEPTSDSWTSLGETVIDDFVVISKASNRLDLFVRGINNSVYQKSWDGSAWVAGWNNLGGNIMLSPSAVGWDSRITLAARGTNNTAYMKQFNGSTWDDWASIGGPITGIPVLDPRGGDKCSVFLHAANNSLYVYN